MTTAFRIVRPWLVAALIAAAPLSRADAQAVTTPAAAFSVTKIAGLNRQGLVADANGDGRLDVIANGGTETMPSVVIAIGRGDGTFDAPRALGVAAQPLVVGDLNLDDRVDIVVMGTDGRVYLVPGNGNGTFESARLVHPYQSDPVFVSAIVGSFSSADSLPDVAVVANDATRAPAIHVYSGNGDLTFDAPVVYALTDVHLNRARGADLDDDGVTDIVGVTICCSLFMFRNTGAMTFEKREIVMNMDLGDIRAADLNGDSVTDVVVTQFSPEYSSEPGRIAVLMGGLSAAGAQEFDTGVKGEYAIALGDFTRDGTVDIATGNWSTELDEDIGLQMWSSVSVLEGTIVDAATREMTFGSPVSFTLGSQNRFDYQASWSLDAADVNGDGHLDLVHTPGAILVNVAPVPNRPPTVFAGPDQTLAIEDALILRGEGSDPDGHWLEYAWSNGRRRPWYAFSLGFPMDPGVYDFTLSVDDGLGGTASDSVTITVTSLNFAAATIEPDSVVATGRPYTLEWITNEEVAPFHYFHVSYSTDGGRTFNPIPECINLPGSARGCVWRSPGPASDRAVLRVETAYGASEKWVDVSREFRVTPGGVSLPSPWQNRDIGAVGVPGSASFGGWFTVRGSGADIWGTSDEFHYVYRSMAGDFDIVSQVSHNETLHEWSKAGLMIRGSTAADAAHVSVFTTPWSSTKGISLQARRQPGGTSTEHGRVAGLSPVWLKLSRRGSVVVASSSPFQTGPWTQVGSTTASLGHTVLVGFAVSSHVDGMLATATFFGTTITPQTSLPSGAFSADVGNVGAPGRAAFDGRTFTVEGSGADIWGTSDEFHWVYTSLSGDFTFTARVASVEAVNRWTKAGLMVRESTSPRSRHASLFATPGTERGVAFQRRTSASGLSSHTSGPPIGPPVWLRLVRSGDVISASYRRTEAEPWTAIGSETLASLPASVLVGLAVSSHVDGTLATATFDRVVLGP